MLLINYITGVVTLISSFISQNPNHQYFYRKCLSIFEYGNVSFVMKHDSSLCISWGGKPMPNKNEKIGIWWENDENVFIQEDNEPLKTYKRDTLIRLSVLVEKNAAEFWFKNKKKIQDSIFVYINEHAWMYETDTQDEKIDGMEEIEYGLGIQEICGKDILLEPPKFYLIGNQKRGKKKK